MTGLNNLITDSRGQKRLQNYFDDTRIRFGQNHHTGKCEAWYIPANSRPYRICEAENVAHAEKTLISRCWADKMQAKRLLADIDAHNEKLLANMQADAIGAVRSDLNSIARGRQHFMAR